MNQLREVIKQSLPDSAVYFDQLAQAVTLTAMIMVAFRLACVIAIHLVEDVLVKRANQPTVWPTCPHCGHKLCSKGFRPRTLLTWIGEIHWRRRVGRCPAGCPGEQIAPLDVELGIQPYQRTGAELKRIACLLAIFVPFETVTLILEQAFRTTFSPAAIWQWVQDFGQQAMTKLEAELDAQARGESPEPEQMSPETAALPAAVGADGVMAPFRPTAGTSKGRTVWREIKVGLVTRLKQVTNAEGRQTTRLAQRRVVAALGDLTALTARLRLETVRQRISQAQVVVWLSDGARGLWQVFEQLFSGMTVRVHGVLDFYHAAQNLWKGACARLDGRTQKAAEWFKTARHNLRHGHGKTVLSELKTALQTDGLPENAAQTLQTVYNYLNKHRRHIQYQKLKKMGLPIGSGMIESVCKWLIQQRFKGVGMRWSENGFNHLLHLRLAWVNGRFDQLFPDYEPSPN